MVFATEKIDGYFLRVQHYLNQNLIVVTVLISVVIAAYGFELFNLNLTIDEEVHAFSSQAYAWIAQGRWGMFLLNIFLLPQPVIPFVPLFIALIFHIFAIFLLLNSWEVESKSENLMVGTIGVAYPGMAYMYTFSTINFGIGIGLFFVALSLFMYVRSEGFYQFSAALPGAISISIYQGFAVALAATFLVYFISAEIRSGRRNARIKNLLIIAIIGILSVAIYYAILKLFIFFTAMHIGYVDTFFDINYLKENFSVVNRKVFTTLRHVYGGSPSVYGSSIRLLPTIIILALFSLTLRIIRSKLSIVNKIFVAILCLVLLVLPFISGYFMRGVISMRFLVALPITFSGLVFLGVHERMKSFTLFSGFIVMLCVFQFVVSTNTLFSASHLVLQADRLLAGRVLERITDAKTVAGSNKLKYIEVVGYIARPSTRLTPKSETFGASFFEWNQGNTNRILLFLKTLGYEELHALPLQERGKIMGSANAMPSWPDKGSVKVFGETVVLKFGPYSYVQKRTICAAVKYSKHCD